MTLTIVAAAAELPCGDTDTVAVLMQDAGPGQLGRLERFVRDTVTLSGV